MDFSWMINKELVLSVSVSIISDAMMSSLMISHTKMELVFNELEPLSSETGVMDE